MGFVGFLGYIRGVVSLEKSDNKRMKYRVDISLLVGSSSREGRQAAFGKVEISFAIYY